MPAPERSYVVTGGAGAVGRAIAARLDGHVVVLDLVTHQAHRAAPAGRVGAPEEMADVVAALPAPGFVNGAGVPVDGGRSVLGVDPERSF